MNKFNAALLALLLAGVVVRADDRLQPAAPKTAPVYFDPSTVDPRAILPPPPQENSDETTKEIEIILQDQADRTQAQVDRIKEEEHYNVFVFQNVVGSWFTPEYMAKMPATNRVLARVMETAKPVVVAAKNDFSRPRPFLINSRIVPCIEPPPDGSYPSGHSTRGMLDALVLAQIDPANSQAILMRGEQIGDDRVIAGVHFPSDVIAGRKLAQAIMGQLMSDPEFQAEIKAARAEVDTVQRKLQAGQAL